MTIAGGIASFPEAHLGLNPVTGFRVLQRQEGSMLVMLVQSFRSSSIGLRAQFGQQLTCHYGKPYSLSTWGKGSELMWLYLSKMKVMVKHVCFHQGNFMMPFLRLAFFLLLLE